MKFISTRNLGLVFLLTAQAFAVSENTVSEDLRLRLPDKVQERRTTSLNWIDMAGAATLPFLSTKAMAAPPTLLVKEVASSSPAGPKPIRVVIDAGHGGKDLGARGFFAVLEKEICLRISMMVRREVERFSKIKDIPIEVTLTRDDDSYLPLHERVRRANSLGADLFLSVHANSSPYPKARGFEVYFLSNEASDSDARTLAKMENASELAATPVKADILSILTDVQKTQHISQSSSFAEVMYQALSRKLRSNGRGVRQAPFTVLAGTAMPALLVEVGYVTHYDEARLLASAPYLKRLANAISNGVVEFILQMKKLG